MKRLILPLLLLAVPAVCAVPAAAENRETVRTLGGRYDAAKLATVAIDIPVGELAVEAVEGSEVSVEMELRCRKGRSRCESAAEKVRFIAGGMSGERLRFRVEGWPKASRGSLEARVRLRLPAHLALDAELGVGELRIEGLTGDVTADLGVGEVTATLPQSAVASVRLDAGIGEAVLRTREKRYENSGVGVKTLRWTEGTGRAEIQVDCGVGEIQVALR
jgi:hypothetical protein